MKFLLDFQKLLLYDFSESFSKQEGHTASSEDKREYQRKWYQSHKEEVIARQRARREAHPDYDREWYQSHREERLAYQRGYDINHREEERKKVNAYDTVQRAIRDGKLVRGPCSVCGNPKTDAHHEDYSKPLEVIWLCSKHHQRLHKSKD